MRLRRPRSRGSRAAPRAQLAAELRRSGRRVVLAVGRHVQLPRVYGGRDALWWMDVASLGPAPRRARRSRPGPPPATVALAGRDGGEATLDLDVLSAMGVELVGRWACVRDGVALFSGGLRNVCSLADLKLGRLLDGFYESAPTSGREAKSLPRNASSPPRRRVHRAGRSTGGAARSTRSSGRLACVRTTAGSRPRCSTARVGSATRAASSARPLRPRPARPPSAQVDLHPHRGRRPRGHRVGRLPGHYSRVTTGPSLMRTRP
jgi:hypothetical protein